MLTIVITTLASVFTLIYGHVLLYDTENIQSMEKFDCVYHTYNPGEEISYCRRLNEARKVNRNKKECENQGVKLLFLDLLHENINPSDVLHWSSSVEMADMYARFFLNRSLIEHDDNQFLCNCTQPGTFGKYCEYQLTHQTTLFSEAIYNQFTQKRNGDSWNTQRYGQILCYETLPCNTSNLCLDWREICDGVQRCVSGIDEENWDKLEFNECEEDEFRCTNGMCISEKFWLNGDYDCMDWSDEIFQGGGTSCSFEPNTIQCDEHVCPPNTYSCGDEQCVAWSDRMAFQRSKQRFVECFNKRNLNYMCEVSLRQPAWTLQNGLCWPDPSHNDLRYPPWNQMNFTRLTSNEKCEYLLRCFLSNGFERDCSCNNQNCSLMMRNECPRSDRLVLYPPIGLIDANMAFFYSFTRSITDLTVELVALGGNLKCRGCHLITENYFSISYSYVIVMYPRINYFLCNSYASQVSYKDVLSPFQYDKFCWNESLTFNGRPYAVFPDACPYKQECISQYRIRDGFNDCFNNLDELSTFEHDYCNGNIKLYRFHCFNNEHYCLPLVWLGTGISQCSNSYDEKWYGVSQFDLKSIKCFQNHIDDCQRIKEYIEASSKIYSENKTSQQYALGVDKISFQSYCDSVWDSSDHTDEIFSNCVHWVCPKDQYQCKTGQCIYLEWVCDGEWDCSDASDEEGYILNKEWSTHNIHLPDLNKRINECRTRYNETPFSKICSTTFQFGCYLSKVSSPLNIQQNPPCINITQIGDGIEDCFNAYDEKNTFSVDSDLDNMWGFNFRCGNLTKLYTQVCNSDLKNNCTEIVCSNHRDQDGFCSNPRDVICLISNKCEKNARCDGKPQCLHGEDEYWCPSNSSIDGIFYRGLKRATIYDVPVFEDNNIICFCPPAYYGRWCEFFSDRISFIVNIDRKTFPQILSKTTLKNLNTIKRKFYLLYSRSKQMLIHKRRRYFNQSDVNKNHPYSVHFDIFVLEKNNFIKEIGSWHYPIYFDYLPAFRLALVLQIPSWFQNITLDPCSQVNCGRNALCMPIFNQNYSYYCSCKHGYYGKKCMLYESNCDQYCSKDSFCRIDDNGLNLIRSNLSCICPLDRFGPRCNLIYDICVSKPCSNNAFVNITLNITTTSSVLATVIQLYDIETYSFRLLLQHAQVYHRLPLTITYDHSDFYAPYLGILKLYHEDLAHPQYFIMYVLHRIVITITESPKHCPNILSSLSEIANHSELMIFGYHHICQKYPNLFCFHDDHYLCICESDNYRVECYNYDPNIDHCDVCLAGGKCIHGNQIDSNDFLCLCPSCYQGHRCEFSLQPFGFTFDSLVIIFPYKIKVVYFIFVIFIFIIGFFNNFCSLVTFQRPTPRKFTVGNYLFVVTCLNQIALLFLLIKIIQITFNITDIMSCKIISYLSSVSTRLTYWLTSWITIDRLLIIVYPTSIVVKNPNRAIVISATTMIVLLGMHVHEIIYYTTIEHLSTDSSAMCVTNFNSSTISTYNRIATLTHYLLPFVIQVISITFLIILVARSRAKTTGQATSFIQVFKKQFQTQKELYITPVIIVLSALPQIILTFTFACTQLTDWQQYILIGAYLLSYAPHMLGFILYVLPSTVYKKEFNKTLFGKRFFSKNN
ncbi:hypothetical protein I4U23_027397 [Adineta vaga]|nr:hypothetical protein I4U23_027397 [Adineta vaga]